MTNRHNKRLDSLTMPFWEVRWSNQNSNSIGWMLPIWKGHWQSLEERWQWRGWVLPVFTMVRHTGKSRDVRAALRLVQRPCFEPSALSLVDILGKSHNLWATASSTEDGREGAEGVVGEGRAKAMSSWNATWEKHDSCLLYITLSLFLQGRVYQWAIKNNMGKNSPFILC